MRTLHWLQSQERNALTNVPSPRNHEIDPFMDAQSLHLLSSLGSPFCISNYTYSCPGWNKVTFIKNKNEVFPGFFLFQVSLNVRGTGTHWISSIKNLNYNIWRIYHLQIQRGKNDVLSHKGKMNKNWHLREPEENKIATSSK